MISEHVLVLQQDPYSSPGHLLFCSKDSVDNTNVPGPSTSAAFIYLCSLVAFLLYQS